MVTSIKQCRRLRATSHFTLHCRPLSLRHAQEQRHHPAPWLCRPVNWETFLVGAKFTMYRRTVDGQWSITPFREIPPTPLLRRAKLLRERTQPPYRKRPPAESPAQRRQTKFPSTISPLRRKL